MNTFDYILIALRAVALGVGAVKKNEQLSADLYNLADLLEFGEDSDDALQEVARLLRERKSDSTDWRKLFDRINAKREALHGKPVEQLSLGDEGATSEGDDNG